jgi:UDP-galactopyranose mutase
VLASVAGRQVPFPINIDTINRMFDLDLDETNIEAFYRAAAEPQRDVRTFEEAVVSRIGRPLYEIFFENYTRKQWGVEPRSLDASVAARVPARMNRDDRYFTDRYQVMPLHGYTRLFERMLASRNIHLLLQADYRDVKREIAHEHLIYTGPIDEYFGHCYGKLPYRSLRFEFKTEDRPRAQPAAVINHPGVEPYTRVTEFKWLTGQSHAKSSLVYEYPTADGDPYYPIPSAANGALYRRYKALGEAEPNVSFLGRLGTYKYYNMDQCVGQALALFDRLRGSHDVQPSAEAAE